MVKYSKDPVLPPRSGPKLPISEKLINLIQDGEKQKEAEGKISKPLRLEITLTAFDYLVEMGVHPTLMQYGNILTGDESEIKEKYFFAGNTIINEGDEIIYENLPQKDGEDIFQAVVTKKI